MTETKGHRLENIVGDLAVNGNVEIGRDVDIHGKTRVAGSLKVEGFLDAPHIKGAAKGLFNSVEELTGEYPNPRLGWFAIVLDATNKEMGILYKAENRGWVATTDEARPYEFIMDSINVFASKGELADAVNDIKGKAALFGTFATRKDANEVLVKYENIDHLEGLFSIPAATEERAGVITAEDKKYLVKSITWNNDTDPSNMNDFVDAGVYDIKGEHTRMDDNLPILNTGGGHTFNARLTVLDSSITGSGKNDDKCITQVLFFSNRLGQGEMYIRTGKGSSLNNLTWEKWSTLQRNVNVEQVTSLDPFIDNGIYSGVLVENGVPSTFVMIVINDYFVGVSPRRVSQFLYKLSKTGEVSYTTRIGVGDNAITWNGWEVINKKELDATATRLLARVQGTSENSNPRTDPFKYLGNFSDINSNDLKSALDALHSTVPSDNIEGLYRATLGYAVLEIQCIAIEYANDRWMQILKSPYRWAKSVSKFDISQNIRYRILYRFHENNAWGDWRDTEQEIQDITNANRQLINDETSRAKAEETAIRKLITDLIGESPETLDSIHEISSWILNDTSGAAAMAAQINKNKLDIENLEISESVIVEELSREASNRVDSDNDIKNKAALFGTFNAKPNANSIEVTYYNLNQDTEGKIDIPAATTEQAGVMTAEDKKFLTSLGCTNSVAVNRVLKEFFVKDYIIDTPVKAIIEVSESTVKIQFQTRPKNITINVPIGFKGIAHNVVSGVTAVIGSSVDNRIIAYIDATNVSELSEENVSISNNIALCPLITQWLGNAGDWTNLPLDNLNDGIREDGGVITESTTHKYTSPILIKRGDTLRCLLRYKNTAMPIVEVDSNGEFIKVLSYPTVTGEDKSHAYTAMRDMYVSLCFSINYKYFAIISSNVSLKSIQVERGEQGPQGPQGPQGEQGNSGYTGAANELEVVNNLTQGGAIAALSAEQGKLIGNFIDGNNIPLTPKTLNPESIVDITPDMKSWVNNNSDGSVADSLVQVYDEVYQNNRQCIELTSTNKGRFYTPLNTEVDFSTNVLRGSICVQKDYPTSDLGSLEVELYSGNTINASHRAVFSVAYANMTNIQYNEQYARGGWYHWCVNPDALIPPTKRGDDFDITSVTHVGIHPYHTSNIPLKVYISNFSVVRNLLKPGVITIVDNFDASVPAMADYAYSKGVKLNLSIVPNWIGGSNSATLEEINRIKKQGHFIFNHTFDHITDTSSNTELEIVEQITKGAEWMHNNGFNRGKFIVSNPSAMFPFAKYKAYMESPLQMLYHHWAVNPNNASDGILLYYPYYPMSRLLNISSVDKCDDAILIAQKAVEKGGIAVNGYHGTFWSADGGKQWKQYIDAIAELDVKHYGIDEIVEGCAL